MHPTERFKEDSDKAVGTNTHIRGRSRAGWHCFDRLVVSRWSGLFDPFVTVQQPGHTYRCSGLSDGGTGRKIC